MRIRRIGVAALASALALSGLIVGSVGVANASKPVLQGTLQCNNFGAQTAVSPGIVSQKSDLTPPKYKDRKTKYTTTFGIGSGCTGSSESGTTPTSFTLTSKAKGVSRVLIHPASECPTTGLASKTKIIFNNGYKLKAVLTSDLHQYAFNPDAHAYTAFPSCGTSYQDFADFVVAHPNDRIVTYSSGYSTGKAYPQDPTFGVHGLIFMVSVSTETILQFGQQADGAGVTSQHIDPTYSQVYIGLAG